MSAASEVIMVRYLWGGLRHRVGRTVALLLGVPVATASFVVLTGAARTTQLQTVGRVAANYRSAYDILVRPRDSVTGLERSRGLVRPNYLSGIFGGISLAQYQAVAGLPGVEVAAPIAMIGYIMPRVYLWIPVPSNLDGAARQLYRIDPTWVSDRGLSRARDASDFAYVTSSAVTGSGEIGPDGLVSSEQVAGHSVPVCEQYSLQQAPGPFTVNVRSFMECAGAGTPGPPGVEIIMSFPLLLAAIDPAAEARLVGLDQAVVSGRYLRPGDGAAVVSNGGYAGLAIPVLSPTRPYLGSSPAPQQVALPAGRFGRPELVLREGWSKKGVAIAIVDAVDRTSVLLFTLILVVCALFVANAAGAAVQARRTELGVLACLGWRSGKLFGAVLTEMGAIGLVAGIAGAALALPVSAGLGLAASPARAALAVPAATLLTLLAGIAPAWRASRSHPAAAVRPPVLPVRSARTPRGVTGLAVTNLLRTPGRTLLGALSLAIGICALTLLLAFTLAFRGQVVGTLLGNAVAVQTRPVDYIAALVTVLIGAFAVADVLYLNIRERGAELAALRALGWRERTLGRLITLEGAGIGLAGSVPGAAAGLAAAAVFTGSLPPQPFTAAVAGVIAGTLIATLAAVLPASLLSRTATAQALAEE